MSTLSCIFINELKDKTHKPSRINELTWLAVVNIGLTVASGEARLAATVVAA